MFTTALALLFLVKLFHYGFAEKFFKQKRPDCPFKITCFQKRGGLESSHLKVF